MGLIVCPLSADYRVNNTVNPLTVKMLFELALLVNGVLLAPLTMLLELDLSFDLFFVFSRPIVNTLAGRTLEFYEM